MAAWLNEKPDIPERRKPCDLPTPQSTASFWHKSPSALLMGHRSTRSLPSKADVVVVGSGMTGSSVAHHLLTTAGGNEKLEVVVLEAREACWGATGRNGGHCQPILFEHPSDPSIGAFELANFHTLQGLIREKSIDCEFVSQPGVRAIYSTHHLETIKAALSTVQTLAPDQASLMHLVTDTKELARLRIPTALGAVVTNLAARMWPYKFVSRILEDLLKSTALPGGTFNLQTLTPVTSIHSSPDTNTDSLISVETPRGTILTKRLVLATNAYTSHLLPQFSDLIVPCRGQMSALTPLPSMTRDNRLKTSVGFLGDGLDDYLIQRPNSAGGNLMFGGGRQYGPSVGVTDDSVIDARTSQYLRSRLLEVLDLPEHGHVREMEASHIWTGIMGFSRDEKPWVGPAPGMQGVFLAAGFTGHGMPNTWLCGKAVALMVMESFTAGDIDPSNIMEIVGKDTGLPKSYVVSQDRMDVVLREREDVEMLDWVEVQRGKDVTMKMEQ